MANGSRRITSVHRVILAIGEHIGAKKAVGVGGGIGVGVDEAADCGVVVARLEVVQAGVAVIDVATVTQGVYVAYKRAWGICSAVRALYRYLTPWVIGVFCCYCSVCIQKFN